MLIRWLWLLEYNQISTDITESFTFFMTAILLG